MNEDWVYISGVTCLIIVLFIAAILITYTAGKSQMRTEIKDYGCEQAMKVYGVKP